MKWQISLSALAPLQGDICAIRELCPYSCLWASTVWPMDCTAKARKWGLSAAAAQQSFSLRRCTYLKELSGAVCPGGMMSPSTFCPAVKNMWCSHPSPLWLVQFQPLTGQDQRAPPWHSWEQNVTTLFLSRFKFQLQNLIHKVNIETLLI